MLESGQIFTEADGLGAGLDEHSPAVRRVIGQRALILRSVAQSESARSDPFCTRISGGSLHTRATG